MNPLEIGNSPCFKNHMGHYSSHEDGSSSEYSCHNPHCKHEKAICRVFNEHGQPVAFKDICQSHPVYLVGSRYSDSKSGNSGLHESPPSNAFEMRMRQHYQEESPDVEMTKTPPPPAKPSRKDRKRIKGGQKSAKKISDPEKTTNKRIKNAKSKGNSSKRSSALLNVYYHL